ncbi:MAG: hypothetical protein WCF92_01985 [bacterium]
MIREERVYPEEWITIKGLNQNSGKSLKLQIYMNELHPVVEMGETKTFLTAALLEVINHVKNKPKQ